MDNADRRNIHARGACRDAGVYGAATECASPTWGRIGRKLRCVSAKCAETGAFDRRPATSVPARLPAQRCPARAVR